MLHLNHAMSSLEHPEVTVCLRFSPSLSLLPVCIFHVSPSLGFQHLRQNPSPKITKELFCSVSSWRLKTECFFFFVVEFLLFLFCFILLCHTLCGAVLESSGSSVRGALQTPITLERPSREDAASGLS